MIKFQLILLTVLAITACGKAETGANQAFSTSGSDTTFCGGQGEQYSPYLICTPAQLLLTDYQVNPSMKGLYFQLANDIDFAGFQLPNHQPELGPTFDDASLGGSILEFSGTLIGGGHVIKNYGASTAAHQSLFGQVSGSISDLVFSNFSVDITTTNYAAAFIAETGPGAIIDHVTVSNGTLNAVIDHSKNSSWQGDPSHYAIVPMAIVVATNLSKITNTQVSNVTANVSGAGIGAVGLIAGTSVSFGYGSSGINRELPGEPILNRDSGARRDLDGRRDCG